jgi:hypothetical protein
MHPAIEIDLRLEHVYAAQRQSPAAHEAAVRTLNVLHQPAPSSFPAKATGRAVVVAATVDEWRRG